MAITVQFLQTKKCQVTNPSNAPLLTDYVIGFRSWKLKDDGELHADGLGTAPAWVKGENHAQCMGHPSGKRHPGSVATFECKCGLHAKWQPVIRGGPLSVIGAIRAWGRMQIHPDGFRAEYAEPLVLFYNPVVFFDRTPEKITRAAERYGIPVMTVHRGTEYAYQFGSPGPQDLIDSLLKDFEDDIVHHLAKNARKRGLSVSSGPRRNRSYP